MYTIGPVYLFHPIYWKRPLGPPSFYGSAFLRFLTFFTMGARFYGFSSSLQENIFTKNIFEKKLPVEKMNFIVET